MSATATLAPLATSNSTVARPMPLPPPVTIIVLPLKSDIYPSNSFLSAFRFHYWNLKRTVKPYRSEEHTSELQSLMRTSYAVFCLKKKTNHRPAEKYCFTLTHIDNPMLNRS